MLTSGRNSFYLRMLLHPDDDDKSALVARLFHDAVNMHDFGTGRILYDRVSSLQRFQRLRRHTVSPD